MRINLDIADDVLSAINERAQQEKRTVGEVLSDLAREALIGRHGAALPVEDQSFYGFDPFPRRGPAVSNEFIDQLRDMELE